MGITFPLEGLSFFYVLEKLLLNLWNDGSSYGIMSKRESFPIVRKKYLEATNDKMETMYVRGWLRTYCVS